MARPNRLVQMKTQEEIIQRKKLEILERQRTQDMVKQLAAAAGIENSTRWDTWTPDILGVTLFSSSFLLRLFVRSSKDAQDAKGIVNTFSNDGSFLENFKKISEQVQQKLHKPPPVAATEIVVAKDVILSPTTLPSPPHFIPPFVGLPPAFSPSQTASPTPQVFFNPHVPPPASAILAAPMPEVSPPPPPTDDVLDIRNAKG